MEGKSKTHHRKLKNIFSFESKKWSVAIFLTAFILSYFVQAVFYNKFNTDVAQANVMYKSSSRIEALQINNGYDIVETDFANSHYLYPGDIDGDVFAFGIKTNEATLTFEGLKLVNEGNLNDSLISSAKLYEGDEIIATARVKNGIIDFRKFTSVLQPWAYKEYKVKIDLSGDAKSGERFRLKINDAYALSLSIDGSPVYSLDEYPVRGAYTSVVGFRK